MATERPSVETRRRAKLHAMLDDNTWEEGSIGHVTYQLMDNRHLLVIRSDSDGSIMFETNLASTATSFYCQAEQDNLLYWIEPDGRRYCLSFQISEGCKDIWNKINEFVISNGKENINEDNDISQSPHVISDIPDVPKTEAEVQVIRDNVTLPLPESSSLDQIFEILQTVCTNRNDAMMKGDMEGKRISSIQVESLTNQLREDYLSKLLDLFCMKEDLEDLDSLHKLFGIIRAMLMLCQSEIFEILLSSEHIMDVIGVLEYDPRRSKHNYREILTEKCVFKEIIPLVNTELIHLIHLNYRLVYLKDVILASSLDDTLFSSLNAIVQFNNIEIVKILERDRRILSELFDGLHEKTQAYAVRQDMIKFLHELCKTAQSLRPDDKSMFFQTLCQSGLIDILIASIEIPLSSVRITSCSVLAVLLFTDIALVRFHILDSNKRKQLPTLLHAISRTFISAPEKSVLSSLSMGLRTILDTETFDTTQALMKSNLLDLFYDDCFPDIVAVLQNRSLKDMELERKLQVLNFVTAFLPQHAYHIRNFLIRNSTLKDAVSLLSLNNNVLSLAIIRMIRGVVGLNNDFFNRHIAKAGIFDPIIDLVFRCGRRYNLLNSSLLDLFETIRKENLGAIIEAIVKTRQESLEAITYSPVFKGLVLRYEQSQQPYESQKKQEVVTIQRKRPDGSMDAQEESWFDRDDDDDDDDNDSKNNGKNVSEANRVHKTTPRPPTRLVDYPDDDNNNDNGSPSAPRIASPLASSPKLSPRPRFINHDEEDD